MVWFNGSISQAIAESKSSSKLFIVYISGEDEKSSTMNEVWNNDEIKELCIKECICLKLDNKSNECQQFSSIYPVLVIPVVFIIGDNGYPLEVIGGPVTANELLEKLKSALQKSVKASSTSESFTPVQNISTQPVRNAGFSDDDEERGIPIQHRAEQTSGIASSSNEEKQDETSKLQEKRNQIRREKMKQAEENERRTEIERRTLGRQVQEMKEKQEDIRKKKDLEERKKDKLREKEALERVREQIARDREEKSKKFKIQKEARAAEVERKRREKEEQAMVEDEEKKKEREKISRIQYRLPDGSAVTRQYRRETTLRECIDDLNAQTVNLPTNFQLGTRIPRRVFDASDEDQTLAHLGLVPSALIFVHPKANAVQTQQGNTLSQIISFLTMVVSFPFKILNAFWNSMFGSTNEQPRNRTTPASHNQDANTNPTSSTSSLRKRVGDQSDKEPKRDGNTHRLHDMKKDDDDSATWNGNSTQQL